MHVTLTELQADIVIRGLRMVRDECARSFGSFADPDTEELTQETIIECDDLIIDLQPALTEMVRARILADYAASNGALTE